MADLRNCAALISSGDYCRYIDHVQGACDCVEMAEAIRAQGNAGVQAVPAPQPQYGMTGMVAMALKPFCKPGQKVIWREPFRWKDEDGVLSNHYEMFELSQLAEDFDYVIVEDFGSAAIIARKDGQPFPPSRNAGVREDDK